MQICLHKIVHARSGIKKLNALKIYANRRYLYIDLRRSSEGAFVRSVGLRASVWSPDSFSSLWAAFMLTVHINTFYYKESVQLYMERKNMQLEYDSVKNIAFIHVYCVEPMKST